MLVGFSSPMAAAASEARIANPRTTVFLTNAQAVPRENPAPHLDFME
jgi:hypothetical protein